MHEMEAEHTSEDLSTSDNKYSSDMDGKLKYPMYKNEHKC